jgi:hypothetical protein
MFVENVTSSTETTLMSEVFVWAEIDPASSLNTLRSDPLDDV